MDMPRVSDSVRRITVLRKDASGGVTPATVYQRGSKRKKGTPALKFFERTARRVADAQIASAESYLARHERSNSKEKDGWVQDLPVNVFRASQKGAKALKLQRLFSA